MDARFPLLLLCFFLSGFAALLYETAWAREFAFVFGTSEFAVVSVLAAYMGGLSAGAAVAARFVARIERPVLVYALLELGIAASALAVPWAIRAAMWLLRAIAGGQPLPPDEASVAGSLFYAVCSFAILMVPTGLMGATLPLLARHAVRRESEIGSRIGLLYSINTIGAVAGTVATGFAILPLLGLRMTVYTGAAINALVFAAAALLARGSPPPLPRAGSPADARLRFHWILPLIALSGVCSFTYEIVWMRLLGAFLGGSIQGFATMLASFLLGIALGSGAASRLARSPRGSLRGFACAQLGTAALSLVAFSLANWLPELAHELRAGRTGTLAANASVAALGLLPGALCVGASFPFAVRIYARSEAEAGPAAARVYAWNTVGAIVGALACGFALLPTLKFEGCVAAAAAVNLLLAAAAAGLARPAQWPLAIVAAAGLAALAIHPPQTPWTAIRYGGATATEWRGEITYYGVGRSSTVLLFDEGDSWRLVTNGQPESTIDRASPLPDSFATARWLGLLPALMRPDARSMLMIGIGGGLSLESVPSSFESINAIELEREVIEAHRVLAPLRGFSPIADPRVRVVVNDARGALMLTDARFDAIVSQPSHPWTAGASHLYTREFFSLVSNHLEPTGVLVQWIGLAFVDEPLLRSLVATLLDVFPEVHVFRPISGAVLFVASNAPIDPVRNARAALAASPQDFARYGLLRVEDLAAAWVLDPAGARRFAEGASLNTDDRNQLATRSGALGKRAIRARKATELLLPYDPLRARVSEVERLYLLRGLAQRGERIRAIDLAKALEDPAERWTALGWVRSVDSPRQAASHFRSALAANPDVESARFGLLALQRSAVEAGDPAALELTAPLGEAQAAVVAGWQLAAAADWSALRALEPALASAQWFDPAYRDALRLRVRWRVASDEPSLRAESTEIASALLQDRATAEDLLVSAQAFSAASRFEEALQLLDELSRFSRDRRSSLAAVELVDALPANVEPALRAAVRDRLSKRRAPARSAAMAEAARGHRGEMERERAERDAMLD